MKDWQLLKLHAFEQGYALTPYIAKGKAAGLTTEQLIDAAYKDNTLEHIIQRQQRVKLAKKVAMPLVGAIATYVLNFAVMYGIANTSVSPGFRQRYQHFSEFTAQIETMEKASAALPPSARESVTQQLSRYYAERQWILVSMEPDIWRYGEIMAKAQNPLNHFKGIL